VDEGPFHEDERINYFTSPDLVDWSDGAILLERGKQVGGFDVEFRLAPTKIDRSWGGRYRGLSCDLCFLRSS